MNLLNVVSSVIGKKANHKTEVTKKQRAKFSEKKKKKHFLPPDALMRVRIGEVRNVCFSEKLVCFVFLLPPF